MKFNLYFIPNMEKLIDFIKIGYTKMYVLAIKNTKNIENMIIKGMQAKLCINFQVEG